MIPKIKLYYSKKFKCFYIADEHHKKAYVLLQNEFDTDYSKEDGFIQEWHSGDNWQRAWDEWIKMCELECISTQLVDDFHRAYNKTKPLAKRKRPKKA